MDLAKKQIAIFYIEKNKGILYTTSSTPFVVQFHHDAINNLEVVDKDKFAQLLTDFITKNELKPMNIFIVLGQEVTLEKELKNIPLSLQTIETEKFLEMVLFHHILSKTYNFSNKTIIVSANRDLCENIISAFGENLLTVTGVIPLSILEEKFPKIKEKFDEKFMLKKIENLKQYFLPLALEEPEKMLTYRVPSFKNPQFIALIGIFVLLLIILGVQLYFQISASKSYQPKPAVTKEIVPVTSTATPISSPSATLPPEQTPQQVSP